MGRFLAILVLSSLVLAQLSYARSGQTADTPAGLPSTPPGKSTVIGGAIRDVDPVRDQFTLKIFGARSMKILYDERTQLYRDGMKIPLRDLRAYDHASVETLLDGTNVFAVSIRILSQSPEGEVRGQVLNYNPATGVLTVSDPVFREPVELQVPTGTPVVRDGSGRRWPVRSPLRNSGRYQIQARRRRPWCNQPNRDSGHARICICVHGKRELCRSALRPASPDRST